MISQVLRIGSFQFLDTILKLANEDQKRGKNQKKSTFSETQQVMTTRCTLPFFWGQSKFQVYIVISGIELRIKTAYFFNSSLTARPIFSKVNGFLVYLPTHRIRKITICGPPISGNLHDLIFERSVEFEGQLYPDSSIFPSPGIIKPPGTVSTFTPLPDPAPLFTPDI